MKAALLMACLFVSSLVAGAQVTQPPGRYSDAALLVNAADYIAPIYSAPPVEPATYVYFANETARVRIEIVNTGQDVVRLSTAATRPHDNFVVHPTAAIRVAVHDRVVIGREGNAAIEVPWDQTFRLGRGEVLAFQADVTAERPDPGEYVIEFDTVMVADQRLRIAPQANRFQFEIRASSPATAADEAVRAAARAIRAREYTTAEQWVAALLKANPRSYVAHTLRAQIAEGNGDAEGALRHFERALSILEANGDQQLLRWTDPRLVRQRVDGIRSTIRAKRSVK